MSFRKLLLADDSLTIQKVVNLTFAEEGIEVITADNGDTALEKFKQAAPDLVMADVNLPGLSGYELCEIIKQNEATSSIPVILLVGTFEPFDKEKAQLAGAQDYMTKPFQSIRELVNTVTNLLASNQPTQQDSTEYSNENAQTDNTDDFQVREEDMGKATQKEIYQPDAEQKIEGQNSGEKMPPAPFLFDLDEFNLLEIPPVEFDFTENEQTPAESTVSVEEMTPPQQTFQPSEEPETSQAQENFSGRKLSIEDFSPEVIEAIADRVVEKLSERYQE